MKKIILILTFISFFHINVNAQSYSCQELIEYTYRNGEKKDVMESYLLLNSSWLNSIESYLIDGKIIVIASIKNNGFEKPYIFCNIPNDVWDTFYGNRRLILNKTIGQQFHDYIFPFQCDCK